MQRIDRRPTQVDRPSDDIRTGARAARLPSLLLGLSLAAALPPDAIVAPLHAGQPVVHRASQTLVDARELETVLNRPTTLVGSGRVALGEVDARLAGLTVQLDAFRVIDQPSALVTVALVTREAAPAGERRCHVGDLWRLANTVLDERGIPREHLVGLGDDGFQALHGGCTAQVAWLTGDRMATVSLISLNADVSSSLDRARAIATAVDGCLSSAACRVPLTSEDELVASLLAQGCTDLQIARALGVSERTAAWCVSKLSANLGLPNRSQVARWAIRRRYAAQAA
jgi:DNA-binding CsgD family transcriptional regulator